MKHRESNTKRELATDQGSANLKSQIRNPDLPERNANPKSKIQNPKSPSRREWLLRLGEAAVLMGFGGVVGEARLDASAAAAVSPAGSALPPGLHEPSNDHLSHALSSDTRFHPIPAGSETNYVRPPNGPFQPEFLTPQEFKTIRRLVELVIGHAAPSGTGSADPVFGSAVRSDRPSATSAVDEVAAWIDLRLSRAAAVREAAQRLAPDYRALAVAYFGPREVEELETADAQKTTRDGLRWLEEESQRRYQKSFVGLDERQQLELLGLISDDRPDKSEESAGTRFFHWIKGEIIRGYYTSSPGLKELDYRGNSFYPEPPGCEGQDRST